MSLEDRLYPLLAVYERMPRPIKHTLGAAYRRLPLNVRLGTKYCEFRRLIQQSENWPSAQMAAWQLEQLRIVLQEAVNYCPYYRRGPAQISSFEDLKKWPMLEKKDLQEHLETMKSTRFRPS